MISEKDLKEIESLSLEEKATRVEKLLEGKETPSAFELGLYLALKMALEIKTGQELGSATGKIVAGWMQKYSPELVEQAIWSTTAVPAPRSLRGRFVACRWRRLTSFRSRRSITIPISIRRTTGRC